MPPPQIPKLLFLLGQPISVTMSTRLLQQNDTPVHSESGTIRPIAFSARFYSIILIFQWAI